MYLSDVWIVQRTRHSTRNQLIQVVGWTTKRSYSSPSAAKILCTCCIFYRVLKIVIFGCNYFLYLRPPTKKTWHFVLFLLVASMFVVHIGVLLAVLEKAEVIAPAMGSDGKPTSSAGTVSAGYQNFLICIEMLFAALALRAAFPWRVYATGCITDSSGRSVTMQSISSSLKVF